MLFRKITICVGAAVLAMSISGGAKAQTINNFSSFDLVKSSTGWLNSENASGLATLPVDKVTYAKISADKSNGGFVNYYQSNDSYDIKAITESMYRITDKVVISGKVSYDYFRGNNMGGSFFLDPSNYPFDLVDSSAVNVGTKNLEKFNLAGAISYKATDRLTFGAKADYITGNYAKFKDLRHENMLMNIDLTAGAKYDFSDAFSIGLNYHFNKSTEVIEFHTYGTIDQRYYTIINYGAFMGIRQEFGTDGVMEDKNPLVSISHGGSLQLNLNLSNGGSWFNELSFNKNKGYYGIPSDTKPIFYENNGFEAGYKTFLNLYSGNNIHTISLDGSFNTLTNYENIFREVVVNTITRIQYYDNREVLNKMLIKANLGYELNMGMDNGIPSWVFAANANGFYRKQEVSMFPFTREQNLISANAVASATKNFVVDKNMYTVGANVGFGMGFGDKAVDSVTGTPSASTKKPYVATYALDREFEYYTANRIIGGLNFKYTRRINDNLRLSAGLNYNLLKGLSVDYLSGSTQHRGLLTIGCEF